MVYVVQQKRVCDEGLTTTASGTYTALSKLPVGSVDPPIVTHSIMAEIHFKDRHGHRGTISETLDVEYAGRWETEVAESLQRIVSAVGADDMSDPPVELFTEIVIELPECVPIREIERIKTHNEPDSIDR